MGLLASPDLEKQQMHVGPDHDSQPKRNQLQLTLSGDPYPAMTVSFHPAPKVRDLLFLVVGLGSAYRYLSSA